MNSPFKFLRRVRIHGGECGAVARALHHEAKCTFSPAVKKMVFFTTNERKKMSTKTTLKRVALVAVSALGFGLLSIAPSQANSWSATTDFLDCEVAYADTQGSATGCVGVAGGRVTISNMAVTLFSTYGMASSTNYYIEVSDGTIVSVDTTDDSAVDFIYGNSATDGVDWPSAANGNTGADADGLILVQAGTAAEAANEEEFVVTRATTGSTTITLFNFDASGVKDVVETQYITWIASADSGVSATESTLHTIASASSADCDSESESLNTTSAAWSAARAATAKTKMSSNDTDGGVAVICVSVRDGAGRPMANNVVEVTISKGNVDDGASFDSTSSRVTDNDVDYNETFEILGDADEIGVATITVKITDRYLNEATLSGTFTFWGDVATVTLTNNSYSLPAASTGNVDADAIYITVKDANGVQIDLDEESFGIGADATDLTVDSNLGTVATNADGKGEEDAAATVTIADVDSDVVGIADGEISVTCLNGYAEEMSIKVWALNRAATAYVTSNSVTYYCAGSVSTVTITPAATAVEKNGTTTLQVTAKDANGYPVADGTSVSLVSTNGGTIAPSSKTTANGTFSTPATFVASDENSKVTVTAVVGSKAANAVITVGTGLSTAAASADAATDAANEAIDAANAATDAANLAAEAADAATVAAEEARDAADAATAAVEALATEVATLMAALKAQITTLANTVAKIAKKVKA